MISYDKFAEYIKEQRVRLGYTQSDISNMMGIDFYRYGRIENGICEPTFIELQYLCKIYDIEFNNFCKIKKPIDRSKFLYD